MSLDRCVCSTYGQLCISEADCCPETPATPCLDNATDLPCAGPGHTCRCGWGPH
jgi:hypothetical protein